MRRIRSSLAILMTLIFATGLSHSRSANAASLESLLAPGKLSDAHAKFESACTECHDRGDRQKQTPLCLGCHKDIAADVVRHGGFHGRLPNVAVAQCKACHGEHRGRDADIIHIDATSFNHQNTDFALEGAHVALTCAACHRTGEKFSKASSLCIGCHRKDDAHKGQLGEKCAGCHGVAAWGDGRFDHNKTSFALRDAHHDVRCNACHLGGKYQGTPARCVSCHAPDDVHQGSRGEKCAECHTTVSWKNAKFDHGKETGFALLGRHNTIDCGACHKQADFKDKLPKDCAGCHRADDTHAMRFGTDCASCHDNDSWHQAEYNHLAKTKFELLGVHARLDCHTCHTGVAKTQKLGKDCGSCHRADDVHGAALKDDCETCHGNEAWKTDIKFDHDLTSYPLLGLHAIVGCAQCHASKAFKGAATSCVGCHTQNDVHKGRLGNDCGACHSPNGWKLWIFDHAKTGFALTGAHGKLKCAECHRKPAGEFKLAEDCASCHRKDDVHLGQYGAQCQRCHSTLSFHGARIL